MAKVHLPKRTVVQKVDTTVDRPVNGDVKTYYLSEEELQRYRKLRPESQKPPRFLM